MVQTGHGRQVRRSLPSSSDFDVVIVGAGVSGINAAYRVQNDAPASTSYVILRVATPSAGRGISGDTQASGPTRTSSLSAFGWNPWPGKESMASGGKIKQYMVESAQQAGIAKHIRHGHKVVSANWNADEKRWEVTAQQQGDDEDMDQDGRAKRPHSSGVDYDYTDKEMVIIGSGATAVSIVPAVANRVKHVTMLQRSPGWYFSLNQYGRIARLPRRHLPR
ncbi:hypothetical protein J3459_019275 [Metarhizium acridum]|nr:hypothetical protein J3459_019275 [Metarhizium acridum]